MKIQKLKKLYLADSVGRPNLATDQPLLLKTTAGIALFGNATDDRRPKEIIRSVKALDELTQELHKIGFDISQNVDIDSPF